MIARFTPAPVAPLLYADERIHRHRADGRAIFAAVVTRRGRSRRWRRGVGAGVGVGAGTGVGVGVGMVAVGRRGRAADTATPAAARRQRDAARRARSMSGSSSISRPTSRRPVHVPGSPPILRPISMSVHHDQCDFPSIYSGLISTALSIIVNTVRLARPVRRGLEPAAMIDRLASYRLLDLRSRQYALSGQRQLCSRGSMSG